MASTIKRDRASLIELTSINAQLKNQIQFILNKLSSFFSSPTQTTRNNSNSLNNTTTENNIDKSLINDLPFAQQLAIYKKGIEHAKQKIKQHKHCEMEEYEKKIKADEETLHNLKRDYDVNINQFNKNKRLFSSVLQVKVTKAINSKKKQLKDIKEELTLLKQQQKDSDVRIKAKENELIALSDECKLIRDNIEYHLYDSTDKADVSNQIEQLTKKNDAYHKDIEREKKEYIKEVHRQETLIQELCNEIDYLHLKVNKARLRDRVLNRKNAHCKLAKDKSTPSLIHFKGKMKQRSLTPLIKGRLYSRSFIQEREDSFHLKSFANSRKSCLPSATENNCPNVVIHRQYNNNYEIYNGSYSKIKKKRNFSFLNSHSNES